MVFALLNSGMFIVESLSPWTRGLVEGRLFTPQNYQLPTSAAVSSLTCRKELELGQIRKKTLQVSDGGVICSSFCGHLVYNQKSVRFLRYSKKRKNKIYRPRRLSRVRDMLRSGRVKAKVGSGQGLVRLGLV